MQVLEILVHTQFQRLCVPHNKVKQILKFDFFSRLSKFFWKTEATSTPATRPRSVRLTSWGWFPTAKLTHSSSPPSSAWPPGSSSPTVCLTRTRFRPCSKDSSKPTKGSSINDNWKFLKLLARPLLLDSQLLCLQQVPTPPKDLKKNDVIYERPFRSHSNNTWHLQTNFTILEPLVTFDDTFPVPMEIW